MSSEVPTVWHQWLLRNLVDGVDHKLIVEALQKREVPIGTAQQWIDTAQASHEFRTLKKLTRRMRQTRQHLTLRRRLNALNTSPNSVRERDKISASDFFQDYYFENRPLVLRGYANDWPARHKWTPEWIADTYGHVEVKVTDDRDSNPDYDMQHQAHTRMCSLREYADRVMTNDSGNNTYMVANNRNIENPELSPILADVGYDTSMFDPQRWKSCSAFWFGPAGTITPLHHDTCNILFVQLYGRKQFRLYSPLETDLLENARSMYGGVDPEAPDQEHYPNFAAIHEYTATLNPGDAIFLPIGWWHHVRSLDVSISFAMTNFVVPNQFDWFRPGEVS